MDYTREFLGRGVAFPFTPDPATGTVRMSAYEEDIAEAIRIILSTRCGERLMRPNFGSRLHEFVFADCGYTIENQIRLEVERALGLWEPRITGLTVEIGFPGGTEGGFLITVSYVVRETNSPYNLVFPYFLTEGHF